MANKKPSTGNPELGKAEKKAKKIKEQIHASCGVSDDVNIDDDFEGGIDTTGGEENEAEAMENNTNEYEETEKTATTSNTTPTTDDAGMTAADGVAVEKEAVSLKKKKANNEDAVRLADFS